MMLSPFKFLNAIHVKDFSSYIEKMQCKPCFFERKYDVNGGRRNKGSGNIMSAGLGKPPTEPFKMFRFNSLLECHIKYI